jgi:tight adherence protein B
MMRRLLIGAVMVLAFLAPGTAAAASPVKLSRLDARFPERSFLVSLPQSLRLTADDVLVTENGRTVDDPTLVPATLARGTRLGVVLVIDASKSMHGGPIAAALAAARTFDSHRLPGERLAVIEFNRTSSVVLPFTEDEQQIQAALGRPPAIARGTHIYDAVDQAVQLLEQAHINGGSVVLLSDGADTGSAATAATVATAAGSSHVRVFTVGLRSHAFQAGPLRSLAAATGGRFSEAASAADLQPIYDELGAELANQYVLRYRSLARAGSPVTVRVKVRGIAGSAESAYVAPALPPAPSTVYHLSVLQRYWRSDVALIVTVLAAALLFGAGTMLLVRPHGKPLSQRMAGFVSIRANQRSESGKLLPNRVFESVERPLRSTGFWARFQEELEIAGVSMPAIQIVLWTGVGTVALGLMLAAISGTPVLALIALVVPVAVRGGVSARLRRTRSQFAEQLPDNLQVLASAMRAGHSFVGALSVVVADCPEPSHSEFQRVVADEQLGVPLEDALEVVATRMASKDVAQIAVVASLQRQTGGNTAEVLDRVTATVRERFELQRLVKTLTAQGRVSRWIVTAIPLVLLAAITLLNPAYVSPLFHRPAGQALLVVAIVMVAAGSLVIRKIVDIEV